jgi:hypothetical protein
MFLFIKYLEMYPFLFCSYEAFYVSSETLGTWLLSDGIAAFMAHQRISIATQPKIPSLQISFSKENLV